MTKVLVATEKPFAPVAVKSIRKIFEDAGFELVLFEKYKDPSELVNAVAEVDALIIRSDIASRQVIQNAKNLKIIVRAGAGYDNIDLACCDRKRHRCNEHTRTECKCCCRTCYRYDDIYCKKQF